MTTEIELKAHVGDSKALKNLLEKKAKYVCAFEKEDIYWISGLRIRLRNENRRFQDGICRSSTFITTKKKEIKDGIEVNEEKEFEIVAPAEETSLKFEDFLEEIGLKRGFSKKKQGWSFIFEGINIELVEVVSLGWFLELEILTDNKEKETFEACKNRLLKFLDSLGVERNAIESRFYSEMLAGNVIGG